ncbi:MAG: alpha/beta fold hydrolase [Acetanaerobacterium sp.]
MTNDFIEEYVSINGITQYFLHYPAPTKRVVLFLHGGPGQSETPFAYYTSVDRGFSNFVYYDQRGAGKTQQRSKTKAEDITIEGLIADLKHTIRYVKEKYHTDEVILLGHSWGTVLGTSYIRQYPRDVRGYIGFGQVVDMRRGEAIGYEKLKEAVVSSSSKRDIKALERLGNYPCGTTEESFYKDTMRFRRLQGRYGFTAKFSSGAKILLKSPIFNLADIPVMLNSLKLNKNLMNFLLTYSILSDTDYETPVYYILGKDDWQVPSTLAAEYFNSIHAPKKKIFWIEDAGHLTDLDNPVMFNRALEDCIEDLCGCVDIQG